MPIEKLNLENITVFRELELKTGPGINAFVGENGTGKTHILKILYSACQAAKADVAFSQKLVRTMLPDDYKISRLIRRKPGNSTGKIKITASAETGKKN